MREMVGGCCVCSDDRGWPENPLVYCDGQSCTVAVHQACYGIVTVPTGPWYCRKCESQERSVKVKCELCPSKYGALKRTDNSGWAHVVCALYIPEVRFGNVTTMEPIQLQLIPPERFNKVCYICEENGKPSNASVGACMQCNKGGCKQQFHVTCAQGLGLLCEEAGNYLDNVKYCGYCQHHYSKLKKGGNVKTIPPYKPISADNHLSDSNSEKEAEQGSSSNIVKVPPPPPQSTQNPTNSSTSQSSSTSSKRKSSSSSKTTTSSSKSSNSSSKSSTSSSSHQKTVHNSNSSKTDKPKVINSNVKSAKSEDSAIVSAESVEKTDKSNASSKEVGKTEGEDSKDSKEKSSKKRKANSRTPTPISVVPSESVSSAFSSVISTSSDINAIIGTSSSNTTVTVDKKEILSSSDGDKPKKAKIESTQSSIQVNQPIVALTPLTAAVVKSASPSSANTEAVISTISQATTSSNQSIIQSAPNQLINSLVVSVPLVNASLSPQSHIINNQTSVVTAAPPFAHLAAEHLSNTERSSPNDTIMTRDNSNQSSGIIASEMSGGGLKITYEKQAQVTSNLQVELERITPTSIELPAKRSRSQSGDKTDRSGRSKSKRAGVNNLGNAAPVTTKRSSRNQNTTSPPEQPGAFASVTQNRIKDSPPSSPSSESQGPPVSGRRTKGRKSAPASVSTSTNNSKDSKDIKLFQNGVHAPHMLGNQLNPNSNMAQKMSDHLNSELEAHSIFNPSENNSNLVGPQLHHRVIASARASSAGSSTSGGSGLSSMLSGNSGAIPQTLDQLLERQWEQGSQFLMEQAQHFDIASLLSCLHQLRAENLRLEEHVSSLLQRRDHLLAVNARLAIPLTGQPATPQSSHPHTVNNIHPAVASSHSDIARTSRHGSGYSSHPQGSAQHAATPVENGLPSDPNQAYQHRSPATSQPQPSPTVRHSPAGSGYPGSGLIRQNADTSGRSAPRPQPYPMYQGPGPSAQQQMVIRREPDIHHQPSSKPS